MTEPGGIEPAQIIFGSNPTPLWGLLVTLPTAQDVARYLKLDPFDEEHTAHLQVHLNATISMVRAYTRGNGFAPTEGAILVREDIAGVLVTATARSAGNPSQSVRIEVGNYSEVFGKSEGLTLAEQLLLNNYRRRTA